MKSIYVVTDIESDGPLPGMNSMLSLASVAVTENGAIVSEFVQNLEPIPGFTENQATMEWWSTQPREVWAAARRDARPPEVVLQNYAEWVNGLDGTPVLAAHPIEFDASFVRWYCRRFLDRDLFWRSGLDLRTFAAAVLGWDIRRCTRDSYPPDLHDNSKHSHEAISDAREYAEFFRRLLAKTTAGTLAYA